MYLGLGIHNLAISSNINFGHIIEFMEVCKYNNLGCQAEYLDDNIDILLITKKLNFWWKTFVFLLPFLEDLSISYFSTN